jgi:hypothetical protein
MLNIYSDFVIYYAVLVGTHVVKDFGTFFFRVKHSSGFLNPEN